ncbi:FXYD domain-containing ion transport regulator 5 isoform X5 [Sus scrofa]|uniref:FXYD domain-containing ion transport regulator n=2 Tax=Sus scrofa TaxID=9823 RepID=A0A480K3L9_PIG|nr:FXYD domain-containing ion transport regulator 5 isoform X5 [Sus scrofa]XP_013853761.1 FXYD domain-containing ion transport regulator 5 isoform X5 [Sus scrofa]XP_013853762.1 FXYD domain-containing ion transport regulator 5 isoform X5 [Sus scrofa]
MSPSDCLCLIITGLILPGLTLEATNISLPGSTTENIHVLTPAPDTVHPELQPTPQTSTLQADDATPNQMETQTQQPTGMDVLLTTDLGADESRTQGPTPAKTQGPTPAKTQGPTPAKTRGPTLAKTRAPSKDVRRDSVLEPNGASEDDPFSYDEDSLRKRGLLVAAVLFITGIVILTSGKCRQLPRLCRNHGRTYRIVSKAQPEREDVDGARAS